MRRLMPFAVVAVAVGLALSARLGAAAPTLNGPLPGPLPLFPADNWWNVDITTAPIDQNSLNYIAFINNGGTRRLHPDLGGDVGPGTPENYGFSYIVVDGTQTKRTVQFQYSDESDGVDHATDTSFPFYPIPDEAITLPHWVEGGEPGNVDRRCCADRHILVVDRDNRDLYELWNCWYDGTQWQAGSGAFFDLDTNARRPDGWTSADAAGLAILPGLIRYDEAQGPGPIRHAFRVTLRASAPFYVFPASHVAGSNPQALPFGARLRLKDIDLSGYPADVQRIFQAMKTYGLIFADNGSDMYISGTYDNRWDNGVLNPAFSSLRASDFDVIELGWRPPVAPAATLLRGQLTQLSPVQPPKATVLPLAAPGDSYLPGFTTGGTDPQAVLAPGQPPLHFYAIDSTTAVVRLKKTATSVQINF